MKFNGFTIYATPHITDATCKCGTKLTEVPNGLLSTAMYCQKCENVYELKLIKTPKKQINKAFLTQCRKECK